MKEESAANLVDALIKSMDEVLLKMKPELDKIEADLLSGMRDFGGTEGDIDKVREWLRPMIDAEVRRGIYIQVTKNL